MNTYTPGPWEYIGESAAPEGHCGCIVAKIGWICDFGGSEPKRENARLMAAAPDLAEALKELMDIAREFYDMDCGAQGSVALENGRLALEKAGLSDE